MVWRPVLRPRLGFRILEFKHFQLEKFLLIDHPSRGDFHAREALNPRADGIAKIVGAAATKKSKRFVIPAAHCRNVEHTEGQLVQWRRFNGGSGNGLRDGSFDADLFGTRGESKSGSKPQGKLPPGESRRFRLR